MNGRSLFLLLAFCCLGFFVWLQPVSASVTDSPNDTMWVVDGDGVKSMAQAADGTVYIGGYFEFIGPYMGSGIPITKSTGNTFSSFPNVKNRVITAISDGSGGWYIGGDFSAVGSTTENALAHINSDGSLDTSWTIGTASGEEVNSLFLSGTTLYVGGFFTTLGGQSRNNLAAVDTVTKTVTSFNPNVGSYVNTVLVSGSNVFIGGPFSTVGGNSISNFAKISTSGTVDTNWILGANQQVYALAISGNTLYVGGAFTSIEGTSRARLAAIDVTSLNGTPTSWNPGSTGTINTMLLNGTTLYVGATKLFSTVTIGGASRIVAALDTTVDTNNATSWNPNPTRNNDEGIYVKSLALDGTTMYIGGEFNNLGGSARNNIGAVSTTTGTATSFNPSCGAQVRAIVVDSSTVYAGGDFESCNGVNRNHLAAVNPTTGQATSWNPNLSSVGLGALSMAIDETNDRLYVGGEIYEVGQTTAVNHLIAVKLSDGTLTSWLPNPDNLVYALQLDSANNKIYAGGSFSNIGGAARSHIAALSTTTNTNNATTWNPGASGSFNYIDGLQLKGTTMYVGGYFTTLGGASRNFLGAVDTTVDTNNATSWNPNPNNVADRFYLDGSTLYVGGYFTTISSLTRGLIAAYDTTTGNLTNWAPNLSGGFQPHIEAMFVDGANLYMSGTFSTINGSTPRNNFAAADVASGTVQSWNPNADTYARVGAKVGSSQVWGGFFYDFATAGKRRPFLAEFDTPSSPTNTPTPTPTNTPTPTATPTPTTAPGGPVSIDLGDPNKYHLRIEGAAAADELSYEQGLYVNDINGDGKKDLIVAAPGATQNGRSFSGCVYVIYSTLLATHSGTGQSMDLSNPANYNIRFDGAAASDNLGRFGTIVADVNGDNQLDLILQSGPGNSNKGQFYILYNSLFSGITGTGNTVDLATSTNYNYRFVGAASGDNFADAPVIVADLNNDGAKDIVVSAYLANSSQGYVYLINNSIFTSLPGTGNTLLMSDSTKWTKRYQNASVNWLGTGNVAAADLDNDGFIDLVIPAGRASYNSLTNSGSFYILYHSLIGNLSGTGATVDLNIGSNYNLRFDGNVANYQLSALGVYAADLNNNGKPDLIVTDPDSSYGGGFSGSFFVIYDSIFGSYTSTGNTLSLSPSTYNIRFDGGAGDYVSWSNIRTADIDYDGKLDLMVGSEASVNSLSNNGAAYIFTNTLLSAIAGTGNNKSLTSSANYSLRYMGAASNDYTSDGGGTWFGDVNGDNRDDTIIGSTNGTYNGRNASGGAYVIFNFPHTVAANTTSSTAASQTLTGTVTATSSLTNISGVQFQVGSNSPSGTWTSCSAVDGAFNSTSESFSCNVTGLSPGTIVYARAYDANLFYTAQADYASWTVPSASATPTPGGPTAAPGSPTPYPTRVPGTPDPVNLIAPPDKGYTNVARPAFKWQVMSDNANSISSYKLQINNGTGSITIDSIPPARTSDYDTSKYLVHYDGFNDGNPTNNYVTVTTKSSSDWSSTNNDGKLTEGKRQWIMTVYYNNGAPSTSYAWAVFEDTTAPDILLNQVDTSTPVSGRFEIFNTTPHLFGRTLDLVKGDERDTKIAAGPQSVDITVRRITNDSPAVIGALQARQQNVLAANSSVSPTAGINPVQAALPSVPTYQLVAQTHLQINTLYHTTDNTPITDNTDNSTDKYADYEYGIPVSLSAGRYVVSFSGADAAGNATTNRYVVAVAANGDTTGPGGGGGTGTGTGTGGTGGSGTGTGTGTGAGANGGGSGTAGGNGGNGSGTEVSSTTPGAGTPDQTTAAALSGTAGAANTGSFVTNPVAAVLTLIKNLPGTVATETAPVAQAISRAYNTVHSEVVSNPVTNAVGTGSSYVAVGGAGFLAFEAGATVIQQANFFLHALPESGVTLSATTVASEFTLQSLYVFLSLFGLVPLRKRRGKTRGTLVDLDTNVPVDGAVVMLFAESGKMYNAMTNDSGEFDFDTVQPDAYLFKVNKTGYAFSATLEDISGNTTWRTNTNTTKSDVLDLKDERAEHEIKLLVKYQGKRRAENQTVVQRVNNTLKFLIKNHYYPLTITSVTIATFAVLTKLDPINISIFTLSIAMPITRLVSSHPFHGNKKSKTTN